MVSDPLNNVDNVTLSRYIVGYVPWPCSHNVVPANATSATYSTLPCFCFVYFYTAPFCGQFGSSCPNVNDPVCTVNVTLSRYIVGDVSRPLQQSSCFGIMLCLRMSIQQLILLCLVFVLCTFYTAPFCGQFGSSCPNVNDPVCTVDNVTRPHNCEAYCLRGEDIECQGACPCA